MDASKSGRNILCLIVICIGFSIGNVWSISLFRPEVRITPLDIVVIFLWILSIAQHRVRIHMSRAVIIFVAWLAIGLLLASYRLSLPQSIVSLSYAIRWLLYIALPLQWLRTSTPTTHWIIIVSSITAVIGTLQYIFLPDTRFLAQFNWDDHYYRLIAQFLDPGFTGFIIAAGLLVLITRPKQQLLSYLLTVFLAVALAFTYSRSSFLAFGVGVLYVASVQKQIRHIILLIGFVAIVLLLPRPGGEGVKLERTNSIIARLHSWSTGIQLTTQSPIWGIGFNTYRYSRPNISDAETSHAAGGSDSSLITVSATMGLVGLVLYVLLARNLFSRLTLPGKTLLIALFVHSLFLNSQFYSPILFLIALLPRQSEGLL